jgi:diacylglycerol kinase (ATP)
MITAGNGTSLGGGFKLTPNAVIDDGLLDLNIITDLTKIKIFRNLIGVYSGNHIYMPEVTTDRTTDLLIESEEGFAAHVDGELLGLDLKKLEVHIVPKALRVIVPAIT